MRRFRFIVIVLLLLSLSFVASSGFAAEPRSAARPTPPRSGLWDTLALSLRGLLTNLWSADGCFLDPLGRCALKPTTDNGCRIDPLGRCIQAQPTTDSGCGIDPLGLCK